LFSEGGLAFAGKKYTSNPAIWGFLMIASQEIE
jgi:hypothetical protein